MPSYERATYAGLTIRAWIGVGVGLLAMAGFYYVLTMIGPKRVEHAEVPVALNAEQWKLSLDIGAIERRYLEHDPRVPPPPDLHDALVEAVSMQEQILRLNPHVGSAQSKRLEELQSARDTVLAMETWPLIESLEEQLEEKLAPSDRLQILARVLEAQRAINLSRALARYKDLAKETELERELTAAQASPLKAAVDEMWKRGRAAMKREDWLTALESYTKAREMLDEVNSRFARTRFADVGFRAQLWATEVSLQGANESAEVDVLVEGAAEAIKGGDLTRAGDYYAQALAIQETLNRNLPQSRFASNERSESLDSRKQAAYAETILAEARELDGVTTELLAQRRILGAVERIASIHDLMTRFATDYPRSNLSDEGLGKKYRFLLSVRARLRELQDGFYDQLVPMRGDESRMIMRTLVDQKTYVSLMRFNPSRRQRDDSAVDSVTWIDAREFCRRAGWILGRAVDLPRAADAQGAGEDVETGEGMAEWLSASERSAVAKIRPATSSDVDFFLTSSSLEKKTQSAGLGFRVVVEITSPAGK